MLNIYNVEIDAIKTLGETMLLTDVKPYYEYANNIKSDNIAGFKYFACRKKDLEKVAVKIPGKQLIEAPENGCIEVRFTGLAGKAYVDSQGKGQVSFSAASISKVSNTK